MTIEETLIQLREPEALEVLRPHWDESMSALKSATPSFLEASEYRISREYCGFGPEIDPSLDATALRIAQDPALRRLAWHCHRLLWEHPDYSGMGQWPALERALGDMSGIFYLLIVMSKVPRVRARHESMGVPDEVTRETCSSVSNASRDLCHLTGGRLGLNSLYWHRLHVAGQLFRLGRMEYMIQPFRGGAEVYRHRESGAVIALAPDGVSYDADGYVIPREAQDSTEHGWSAVIRRGEDAVSGYPISPLGMAVRREVRLPLSEWECVLTEGDWTLDMHIPAGGEMTLERCGDSMRRAVPFFEKLFPDQPCRAFRCSSWIFNPQFEQIRLSSDNLVRFQRELYLFPTPSNGRDGFWFIFRQDDVDPATAPRDTSLRRGVADFLLAGNSWRGGGMFFLTEHLAQFGTQYYRSHWPPEGLEL